MEQLYTRWGKELDPDHVLAEYPRPLMVRDSYVNLNGYWDYAFTKEFRMPEEYDGKILVPFSPESVLSGVSRQLQPDEYLWYHRSCILTGWEGRRAEGHRLILHFGAVDQACVVYVNGKRVARHTGGYLPFEADITEAVKDGENELVAAVKDLSDTSYHARGKQKLKRGGMFYTAQSGIWQTVWMEEVPGQYIRSVEARKPDPERKMVQDNVVGCRCPGRRERHMAIRDICQRAPVCMTVQMFLRRNAGADKEILCRRRGQEQRVDRDLSARGEALDLRASHGCTILM